jgi:hypothetical protein
MYSGRVCLTWIASKLRRTDVTDKKYSKDAPQKGSLSEFFTKVDRDGDWFPGKHNGAKRGPKPLLTTVKRRRIAASGMVQKATGEEPSVEVTIIRCPVATSNPIKTASLR